MRAARALAAKTIVTNVANQYDSSTARVNNLRHRSLDLQPNKFNWA